MLRDNTVLVFRYTSQALNPAYISIDFMTDHQQLDPIVVRRAFGRAAATYDSAAVLQSEVRTRLLERLQLVRDAPQTILDLGAGTGFASRELKKRFRNSEVIALDFALPMLQQARRRQSVFRRFGRVCASAIALPLRDNSIDWCVSNLMLPWSDVPDPIFAAVNRVLKPNGLFSFTTFGPDTLHELRNAWAKVDRGPHVHRFIDMHDLGDALLRAGFAEPVMDVERIVLTYDQLPQLFRELKQTGSTTATLGRIRHLGSRELLRALVNAYEPLRSETRLPVTFEIVYGQAWCTEAPTARQSRPETRIPIASIGRRN